MSKMPRKLPKKLYKYFWDTDPKKIDTSEHSEYVISRLLSRNNLDAPRWVIKNYPREEIVETIKTRRGLSPKDANFWSLYFNIPREEVECLKRQSIDKHVKTWPY